MENSQLLAAVLRAPDDDTPREQYAAWCAVQPDEPTRLRADFIAAQLRLAREEAALNPRERYALRYQTEQLEARLGQEWAAGIATLVSDLQYDRGFVEAVTLPAAEFLKSGQWLFARAPIRHLDLTDVLDVAEPLFQFPLLRRIRSLDLARNALSDAEVELLAASPHLSSLRWLSLADNRVRIGGADALARSPLSSHLSYVVFHGNPFQPNERYSYDSGSVVDSWIPEDGVALEFRHGELPWLRHRAHTIEDAIPDRYRIQGQTSGVR